MGESTVEPPAEDSSPKQENKDPSSWRRALREKIGEILTNDPDAEAMYRALLILSDQNADHNFSNQNQPRTQGSDLENTVPTPLEDLQTKHEHSQSNRETSPSDTENIDEEQETESNSLSQKLLKIRSKVKSKIDLFSQDSSFVQNSNTEVSLSTDSPLASDLHQTQTAYASAQQEYNNYQDRLVDIQTKLYRIDSLNRFQKTRNIFERQRLTREKSDIQKKVDTLQTQIANLRQSIEATQNKIELSKQKQQELTVNQSISVISEIKSDYETFLLDIEQDGAIRKEIQEAYILAEITPLFNETAQWVKLPDDQKALFYLKLRDILEQSNAPFNEIESIRQDFSQFLSENRLYDVEHACRPLIYGRDKNMITEFVAKIASSDISNITTTIKNKLGYNAQYQFDYLVKKAINPDGNMWDRNDISFSDRLLQELEQRSDTKYPNMPLWNALKLSQTANEVFGDLIEVEDNNIFNTALEKSLTDHEGKDIDILAYYPRPEAIRNLVILAAADHANYRTVHANSALTSLARRNDWHEILDQAEKMYPSLKSAHTFLETWKLSEHYNNPGVQEEIKEFALSIINEEKSERKLADLAAQALPNHSLIDLLNQRGLISTIELTTLKETEILLNEIKDKWDEIRSKVDRDIPYIDSFSFKTVLRENLFNLLHPNTNKLEQLEVTKRLTDLSQQILDNQTNYEVLSYLTSYDVVNIIAKGKIQSELIFSLPEHAPLLFTKEMVQSKNFVLVNADTMLTNTSDTIFLNNLCRVAGSDTEYFLGQYQEGLQNGTINQDNRDKLIEIYQVFIKTYTTFTPDRVAHYMTAAESPFGKALADLVPDKIIRDKMLFDYACFSERSETNKVGLIIQMLRNGVSSEEMEHTFELLRWLPDENISFEDTHDTLEGKYKDSQRRLTSGFQRIFPNSKQLLNSPEDIARLNSHLAEICERFKLERRSVRVEGIKINLPINFIKEFNLVKKQNPDAQFIPELASYLIRETSTKSTAYTLEDLMFSQIGETEDLTGRRRGRLAAEQLLEVMESNVEASLYTWDTAIQYQKEKPNSPLFIIANERTGPSDLAAEYLPKEFAQRFKIFQGVDYDKVFEWFRENEDLIEQLYTRLQQGKNINGDIPQEISSLLGIGEHSIIPIYRIKVPSSLNGATDEPEGIDTVLNFLKLTSILGGRTLFMDESTRSAPRSIECLYNVINRRQDVLGGANLRLFGKINGVEAQNGTQLQEITPNGYHLEIGFIDPWHSGIKSVTDDSEGFVPEVTGKGIVEVIRPSFTSISPYGISTIQDFWKQLIANEVSLRYDGFSESGGQRKSREEFKPSQDGKIFTQSELKDMAFEKPYKALVLDLDGTIGSRGRYNPRIISKLKELAESGTDVIIATARSLINHPEYDGSVDSLIQQFGELSEAQRKHIHLATENGAAISTIGNTESPQETYLISEDTFNSVGTLLTRVAPEIRMYREQGTLTLRDFPIERKQEIMNVLRAEIENLELPLKIGSDSRNSINIRIGNASKRNVLNWLESKGININDIVKIGDSPEGNDKPMFWGRGSFNVGQDQTGTMWTIHMNEQGGGPAEVEKLLERLKFSSINQ